VQNYIAQSCSVTTGQATNVYTNSANVSGNISNYNNGYNNYATAYFQYGTNAGNLNLTTNPVSVSGNIGLNGNLTGLNCGTTYYYRAVANVNSNLQYGQTLSFTTQSCQNYVPQYVQPQVVYVPKTVYVNKYVPYHAPKKRVGYKTVKYYY
jgi:hypothetical protein